ncbi:MAG: lysylphosphatidylglycerol synthase domain-containing protein [Acidobacteriota bacterium]
MRWRSPWLRALGALLTVAGLAWVMWVLVREGAAMARLLESPRLFITLALAAVFYAVATLLAASAWWWLLAIYGERPAWRVGYSLWARTQIAKYLPGNVFHYVGRQALGRRLGLRHATLAAAAFLELMTMLVAAALLGAAALASSSTAQGTWGALLLAAGLGAFGLVAFRVGDSVVQKLSGPKNGTQDVAEQGELREISRRHWVTLLVPPMGLHAVFLAATSGLVWLLSWALRPEAVASFSVWQVMGLYALAWAAGTVSLGAPAGLGVREAVLTLQLSPLLGPGPAAAVALALRFVTLLGDLFTALAGHLFSPRRAAAPGPLHP